MARPLSRCWLANTFAAAAANAWRHVLEIVSGPALPHGRTSPASLISNMRRDTRAAATRKTSILRFSSPLSCAVQTLFRFIGTSFSSTS